MNNNNNNNSNNIEPVLGIDPGKTGGLALLGPSSYYVAPHILACEPMPLRASPIGKREKRPPMSKMRVCPDLLFATAQEWHSRFGIGLIAIENVNAAPGQSPSGSFRFGEAFGIVQTLGALLQVPMVFTTPQEWKRHYGLGGGNKKRSISTAIDLIDGWPKVPTDGPAEAALIALYAKKRMALVAQHQQDQHQQERN